MRRLIVIAICLINLCFIINSQNIYDSSKKRVLVESSGGDSVKAMLDEYEKIQLPPLSLFLNSANDHPSAKIFQAKVDEADAEYQIVKYQWLDYLRAVATYQYGYNNSYSNLYNVDDPVIYNQNKRAEHRYSVGATLNIPLGDLITQKQKRRKQKAVLNQLKYEYDISLEERKLTILQAYNTVLEQLATIKVKAEAAALYNAQMKISEDDFVNGKIDIIALSLERQRRSDAMSSYQQSRVALHNAITLLELLTNVSIMKK